MTMSIKEFIEKSKGFPHRNKDVFIAILFILLAFGSFGLGRLSMIEELKTPVRIDGIAASVVNINKGQNIQPAKETLPPPPQGGGLYVGSKNGSKYQFPWCSGAKRIKEGNKVIFNTKEGARAAGYTPAGNCKGLD